MSARCNRAIIDSTATEFRLFSLTSCVEPKPRSNAQNDDRENATRARELMRQRVKQIVGFVAGMRKRRSRQRKCAD
jgi:hypothetical protein